MSKNKTNHDNLNPNFNRNEPRYDHPRPSNSARNSRQSSRNGSKNDSRHGSVMKEGNRKLAKGNSYNKNKQNGYHYKPRKLSQNYYNNKEDEALLVQEKRPHKRDNSNLKNKSTLRVITSIEKLASMEYFSTPMYKKSPMINEIPYISPEEFPTRYYNTFDKAARELEAFKHFNEAGDSMFT